MGKSMQVVAWGTGVVLVAGLGVAVLAPTGGGLKASSSASSASSSFAARAAIGAGGSAGGVAGSAAGGAPAAAGSATPAQSGALALPSTVGPPATVAPPVPTDTIVRSGSLDIAVARGGFTSAFSAAAAVAQAENGFVVTAVMGQGPQPGPVQTVPGVPDGIDSVGPSAAAQSSGAPTTAASTPAATAPTSGTIVLRIPGTKFDDARRRLEALGSLRAEQLSGQDAGGQLADLGARLADLQSEQAGLRAMEAKAPSTDALLQIQTQLATVQQEIDGLAAQQATLQNQVSLASLTVSIEEPVALAKPARSVLSTRLAQAGHGAEAMLGGIIVVLAYGAPLAALLGVAGLAWVGWRRRRVPGTVS